MTNEATETASLFMGVRQRECQNMNCTRRCSCGYGFGRGFDSRRLHQILTSILIQCWSAKKSS